MENKCYIKEGGWPVGEERKGGRGGMEEEYEKMKEERDRWQWQWQWHYRDGEIKADVTVKSQDLVGVT